MSFAPLVFAFVFLAMGIVFLSQSKKEGDSGKARNSRFAGNMMLLAAGGFFVAFAISFFGRDS